MSISDEDVAEYWKNNNERRIAMLQPLREIYEVHLKRLASTVVRRFTSASLSKLWQDAVAVGYYIRVREEENAKEL